MNRLSRRPSLVIGGLLILLMLGLAIVATPAARAEQPRDEWVSSADPPADYPAELMSVPGDPARAGLLNEMETAAGASVISHRIAGSALRPRANNVDYAGASGGGCVYNTGGSQSTVWNAPIHLPQRSRVDSLRLYYNDTSGGLDGRGWFTVYDLYGSIVFEWGVSSVGSSGTGFADTGTINHEIDYSQYSYVLNWRPNENGTAMQLCGFRIFYQPPPLFGMYAPNIMQ